MPKFTNGRVSSSLVAELKRMMGDVTVVHQVAVKFRARCEANRIKLENCPVYILKWIEQGIGRTGR